MKKGIEETRRQDAKSKHTKEKRLLAMKTHQVKTCRQKSRKLKSVTNGINKDN